MNGFLFVTTHYYPNVAGGAELSVQNLAEELLRRGKRVVVVSLSTTGMPTIENVNGARVYRITVSNVYQPFSGAPSPAKRALWHALDIYNPRMEKKLGDILDKEAPRYVSTHTLAGFSVATWAAAKARGATLSHMLHDYYLMCPRSKMAQAGKMCMTPCATCRIYSHPKRIASQKPDVVVGVSKFVLDRHVEDGFFPEASKSVIHNGRVLPVASSQGTGAEPRPHTSSVLRLGYIGRVERAKGLETLLKAVSRLPPDRWTLSVAGRGTPEGYPLELKQRYPLPQVRYLGYVNSSAFYKTIDAVVVPSEWHEPLPAVAYEPMGFGLPVVGARVGGIPEILGDAGLLFEPGNVDELYARLLDLLTGKADLPTLRARALVRRNHFVPERQADQFLRLLGA